MMSFALLQKQVKVIDTLLSSAVDGESPMPSYFLTFITNMIAELSGNDEAKTVRDTLSQCLTGASKRIVDLGLNEAKLVLNLLILNHPDDSTAAPAVAAAVASAGMASAGGGVKRADGIYAKRRAALALTGGPGKATGGRGVTPFTMYQRDQSVIIPKISLPDIRAAWRLIKGNGSDEPFNQRAAAEKTKREAARLAVLAGGAAQDDDEYEDGDEDNDDDNDNGTEGGGGGAGGQASKSKSSQKATKDKKQTRAQKRQASAATSSEGVDTTRSSGARGGRSTSGSRKASRSS